MLGLSEGGLIDIYPVTGAGRSITDPLYRLDQFGRRLSSDMLIGIDFREDGILFGVGDENSDWPHNPSLYTIDPTTGVRTIVGRTGGLSQLEFADSTLYAIESGERRDVYTVDDETGQVNGVGPDFSVPLYCSDSEEIGDIAYDANTDMLYGLVWLKDYCEDPEICSERDCILHDVTDLYKADLNTGESTLVGPFVAGNTKYKTLEFNYCNGFLYGSEGASLFTIDPANSVRTLVGPIGYDLRSLTFNPNEFVGKFSFTARLTNTSSNTLSEIFVEVVTLTNGNSCRNFDGGSGDIGLRMTIPIPIASDYSDGELSPGESVDVNFVICLKDWKRFRFFVDVFGVPGS